MTDYFSILSSIICIPFLGMLFVLTVKSDSENSKTNCSNVAIFTILANMVMIWRVFMLIDEKKLRLQLFEKIDWVSFPDINLVFAVDNLSLMMLLSTHLVVLTAVIFVRHNIDSQKPLMAFSLLFLSMVSGFFVAADIFSFFIFFEAMLLPIFMLIGMYGKAKRLNRLNGFFIYNMIGITILFLGILLIYKYYGNLRLDQTSNILWNKNYGIYIWGALAVAFISRIPIWPFHYWISSISSKINNPLVFIISSALPLSGIYGFIRFWPKYIPLEISQHFIWLNVIGVFTMLFISLIGFIHHNPQYKIFAFVTVYYIMYLLGIFTQDKLILNNLGYALFGFILVFGSLNALLSYILCLEKQHNTSSIGFLCRAKRLSLLYSFLTFAAIGFPVSAMFTNNFLILSKLLSINIQMGSILMFSCIMASGALIVEMFKLKTDGKDCTLGKKEDISIGLYLYMLVMIFILLMSFIRPLWFVINE